METQMEKAWVGLKVVRGGVSESHRGGVNSMSHVDGDSDILPVSLLSGVGGGLIE